MSNYRSLNIKKWCSLSHNYVIAEQRELQFIYYLCFLKKLILLQTGAEAEHLRTKVCMYYILDFIATTAFLSTGEKVIFIKLFQN